MTFIRAIKSFLQDFTSMGRPVHSRPHGGGSYFSGSYISPSKKIRNVPDRDRDTAFEQTIRNQFDIYRKHRDIDALLVTVMPYEGCQTSITDPVTRKKTPATFRTLPLTWEQASRAYTNLSGDNESKNEYLAMILDMKGAPPEEQIPGWEAGTMELPEQFIHAPFVSERINPRFAQAALTGHPPRARTKTGQIYTPPSHIRGVIVGGPRKG